MVVWRGSANRDEHRLSDPFTFHVHRDPNLHLAFGHGAYFCLGAHLARLEMRIALSETLDTFCAFDLNGSTEWTRSNRHTGLRHLPLSVTRSLAMH